MKRMLRIKC
jgi:hypothetical protein